MHELFGNTRSMTIAATSGMAADATIERMLRA